MEYSDFLNRERAHFESQIIVLNDIYIAFGSQVIKKQILVSWVQEINDNLNNY